MLVPSFSDMEKTTLTPENNRLLAFRKNPVPAESDRNGRAFTIDDCNASTQSRGKKSRIPANSRFVKTVPVMLMETSMPATSRKLMQNRLAAKGSRLSISRVMYLCVNPQVMTEVSVPSTSSRTTHSSTAPA